MSEDVARIEVELRRVVDRLAAMPLARAESISDRVHEVAGLMVERTRAIDPALPSDATLPRLAPSGLAPLLAVLGRDYLTARAGREDRSADREVADALTGLRRELP